MTKMIESLAAEISKLKVEQTSGKTRQQNTFAPRNSSPFRKENEQLQIMQRGEEAKEYHKVKAPFQNAIMEEEQFEEDEDEIHCFEDKGSAAFLTLAEYEESLLQEQNNQRWDNGVVLQSGEQQQRYNLRSNAKNVKENVAQEAVAQTMPQNSGQRRPATDPVTLKAPV